MAGVLLHMEAGAHRLDRVSYSTSSFHTRNSCSGPGSHCAHLASGENGLRYFSGTLSSPKHTLSSMLHYADPWTPFQTSTCFLLIFWSHCVLNTTHRERNDNMVTILAAATANYRRDLGDGLILRWSTAQDTENIAQLCSMVFRDKADEPANEFMLYWIRRLMRGDHPVMGPGDFGVVEDARKEGNPLVACTCLWRHNWEYESVPFAIGRPEIVGSDPAYRNRGLIRA